MSSLESLKNDLTAPISNRLVQDQDRIVALATTGDLDKLIATASRSKKDKEIIAAVGQTLDEFAADFESFAAALQRFLPQAQALNERLERLSGFSVSLDVWLRYAQNAELTTTKPPVYNPQALTKLETPSEEKVEEPLLGTSIRRGDVAELSDLEWKISKRIAVHTKEEPFAFVDEVESLYPGVEHKQAMHRLSATVFKMTKEGSKYRRIMESKGLRLEELTPFEERKSHKPRKLYFERQEPAKTLAPGDETVIEATALTAPEKEEEKK